MQHGQLQAAVAVEVADGQLDRTLEHRPISNDERTIYLRTPAELERRAGSPGRADTGGDAPISGRQRGRTVAVKIGLDSIAFVPIQIRIHHRQQDDIFKPVAVHIAGGDLDIAGM